MCLGTRSRCDLGLCSKSSKHWRVTLALSPTAFGALEVARKWEICPFGSSPMEICKQAGSL